MYELKEIHINSGWKAPGVILTAISLQMHIIDHVQAGDGEY